MRISQIAEDRVLQALKNNGVLEPDRKLLSHEIVPVGLPAGQGELLLGIMVFLDMPAIAGPDHIEHQELLQFPFAEQEVYDTLVGRLLEKIYRERNEEASVPAGLAAPPPARSGLLRPGQPGFSTRQ